MAETVRRNRCMLCEVSVSGVIDLFFKLEIKETDELSCKSISRASCLQFYVSRQRSKNSLLVSFWQTCVLGFFSVFFCRKCDFSDFFLKALTSEPIYGTRKVFSHKNLRMTMVYLLAKKKIWKLSANVGLLPKKWNLKHIVLKLHAGLLTKFMF